MSIKPAPLTSQSELRIGCLRSLTTNQLRGIRPYTRLPMFYAEVPLGVSAATFNLDAQRFALFVLNKYKECNPREVQLCRLCKLASSVALLAAVPL